MRKGVLRRNFTSKVMVGAGSNHGLVEKFILIRKVAVNRLHGDTGGLGDGIHGCAGKAVAQKVLPGATTMARSFPAISSALVVH